MWITQKGFHFLQKNYGILIDLVWSEREPTEIVEYPHVLRYQWTDFYYIRANYSYGFKSIHKGRFIPTPFFDIIKFEDSHI